ncbi:MAG: dUTP diphosphatase [Pseudomonadales bacterium]
MSHRFQQFKSMLQLQDSMNTKVHPEWIQQGYAYYRALWLECGELVEHYGYKWWKKQTPDMQQVQLEVVDIWHFGLSMLFDGRTVDEIAAALDEELQQGEVAELGVLDATEALAEATLATRKFSIVKFWSLLRAAEMNADILYRSYVGKNVLNFFRQDNGYQEGSYIKLWQGREDNEHLVELSEQLDADSDSYAQDLYAALTKRYQSVYASEQ